MNGTMTKTTNNASTTPMRLHPVVVALCSSIPDDDDTNGPIEEQSDGNLPKCKNKNYSTDTEMEIPLSPLTCVSMSSFRYENDNDDCLDNNNKTDSTGRVPNSKPNTSEYSRYNKSDHHHHHHPNISTSDTFASQRHKVVVPVSEPKDRVYDGHHNFNSSILLCCCIVQEYQIIQTLRSQSLLYHNRCRDDYGTTWYRYFGTARLSKYLDDMNLDLHYVMTKKLTSNEMKQQFLYHHHLMNIIPKESVADVEGVDPVVEWENYMDNHNSTSATTSNRWPIFTYTLMTLCTIVLLLSFHLNEWTIESFRDNSSFGPSSDSLIQMGVLSTKLFFFGPSNNEEDDKKATEWYRIITTIGIHGGILHWIISMIAILYVGVPMERRHGTILMGGTFFMTSIAANVCTLVYSPFSFILSPMGGISAWYGLRLSHICTHYWTLRQLYKPPSAMAMTLSGRCTTLNLTSTSSPSLSRTIEKTPKPFPFYATLFAIFLEIVFLLSMGLLPWINQFSNCCGLLYGMVIGIHIFQPTGSTFTFIQLYRQVAYLAAINDESKPILLRTVRGWMHRLVVPVQRRIIPGLCLCVIIGFSTSNALYLYYSTSIGDLPCRSCHYVDCVPFPSTIYQRCEPCNFIKVAYVTIATSTNVDKDDAGAATESNPANGTNYFIDMICPYGETTYFVIPNQLPQNRQEWLQSCHTFCEF
jgi:membrane associated rhomboid family serine protease